MLSLTETPELLLISMELIDGCTLAAGLIKLVLANVDPLPLGLLLIRPEDAVLFVDPLSAVEDACGWVWDDNTVVVYMVPVRRLLETLMDVITELRWVVEMFEAGPLAVVLL